MIANLDCVSHRSTRFWLLSLAQVTTTVHKLPWIVVPQAAQQVDPDPDARPRQLLASFASNMQPGMRISFHPLASHPEYGPRLKVGSLKPATKPDNASL